MWPVLAISTQSKLISPNVNATKSDSWAPQKHPERVGEIPMPATARSCCQKRPNDSRSVYMTCWRQKQYGEARAFTKQAKQRAQSHGHPTHLRRLQVGHEAEPASVAKLAIHGAPHLGRHADSVAGLPLRSPAWRIEEGRRRGARDICKRGGGGREQSERPSRGRRFKAFTNARKEHVERAISPRIRFWRRRDPPPLHLRRGARKGFHLCHVKERLTRMQ